MKVLLMDPARPFDPGAPLPSWADDLVADLELQTLFDAIAGTDKFMQAVARAALLSGPCDVAAILWRQRVLEDCRSHPEVIERLYDLSLEAIRGERGEWGFLRDTPETVLPRSVRVLKLFVGVLRRLRETAQRHAPDLRSPGLQRFCAMLAEELSEDYLKSVEGRLELLEFKRGSLIGTRLGSGLKGTEHRLLVARERGLRERLTPIQRGRLSFQVADRDEAGYRQLAELTNRGANTAANAVAQSTEHILAFFNSLAAELAFYRGAVALEARLHELGMPTCTPEPAPIGQRRLSARDLRDPTLALASGELPVGSDLDADGRALVMITGANRGGKSTFLRSLGVAQLMMQSGMFVAARQFTAETRERLFTHYRREEDERLRRGKLDEELERMARIAGSLTSGSMLLCNESFASTNEREGSEIARQVVLALVESGVRVGYVTHMFELADWMQHYARERATFLRAEPGEGFRLREGAPQPTSHAAEAFARVFGSLPERGAHVVGRASGGADSRSLA